MKNCGKKYDERQIIERGRAFQYSFITLFGLMTLCFLLGSGLELYIFDDMTAYMFCIWPSITVCFITMVVRDAFDFIGSRHGRLLFSFYGLGGAYILASTAVALARGQDAVFAAGKLGHASGDLICGFCCVLVCAVYWVHTLRRAKAFRNGADA